jgi:hypothetical protein
MRRAGLIAIRGAVVVVLGAAIVAVRYRAVRMPGIVTTRGHAHTRARRRQALDGKGQGDQRGSKEAVKIRRHSHDST